MTDPMVARAEQVARRAHAGQNDEAGRDHVDAHVADGHRRVAGGSPEVQAVALLHDVLEDTSCTEAQLRAAFPAAVVDAVVAITHRPDEPRPDHHARVRTDPVALRVELADVASDTDPGRMALPDEPTRTRLTAKCATAPAALGR